MLARTGLAAASRPRALALLPQQLQGLASASQTQKTLATNGAVNSSLGASGRELWPAHSALQARLTQSAGGRFFSTATNERPLHFDTHHVVKSLQEKGSTSRTSSA
jgi:hypothetical protein